MEWFLLALLGLFFFAGITLIQKHLLNLGIHPVTFGVYLMGLGFVAFLITAFITKQSLTVPGNWWMFLVIIAVLALAANLLATYSFKLAPNPGYAQAIISASSVVVLVVSLFLFKSELSLIKIIGVILTIIGIFLIGFK